MAVNLCVNVDASDLNSVINRLTTALPRVVSKMIVISQSRVDDGFVELKLSANQNLVELTDWIERLDHAPSTF